MPQWTELKSTIEPMINACSAKSRLRAKMAEVISLKSAADLKLAGAMLAERFLAWFAVQGLKKATTVALFRSMRDEIDMSSLDEQLERLAVERYFPRAAPYASDGFNFESEPGAYARASDMDVILVPGRAFDEAGRRLGRGGGHYDQCLTPLSLLKKPPILVGVALDEQVVALVPSEPHDVAMDFICTPTAMFKTNAS